MSLSDISVDNGRSAAAVWALAPLLMLGPLLSCGIPGVMAPLFIGCALVAVSIDSWQRRARPDIDRGLATLFGAFLAFGIASIVWSINPEHVLPKTIQLILNFGASALLVPVIGRMGTADFKRIGVFLMIGLGLGLAMYLSEVADGFKFYDLLRGGSDHDPIDSKQNKAVVLSALWLYLAFAFFFLRAGWRKRVIFVLAAACVIGITIFTHSASAQVVLLAVIALTPALLLFPARTGALLTLAVSGLIVATMPMIALEIDARVEWRNSSVLNDSIKSRIEIWDQAARRTREKTFLGWGLDSARAMPNRGELSYLAATRPYARYIHHLHPHNGPLQIWFETGAAGAAMLVFLFALFARRLCAWRDTTGARFGTFIWAVAFLYTLSIWGIWQTWFVSTLCFAGVAAYAGMRRLALEHSAVR
ncbi:MAG: O-antigen ligase family protein [Rhodospirillales bacterium]|nr:O-antigen ligase family protein [Alphaproteobacteria bacterium]MCB9986258.1 O-antigen ligase family protein [Rhodospirillales bacterium]USO07187.1 MAG: O-antigen ligase family protein [Rhodospirillales bacterium]